MQHIKPLHDSYEEAFNIGRIIMRKTSYMNDEYVWEQEFIYSYPIKIRFSDTDMFGHVNNTTIFTYFEEARIEFFKTIGIMKEWMSSESFLIPVVADLQCDFLAQTFFDEVIEVYVKIEKVGKSSIDLHYMCKKADGVVSFVGRGTIVQISKQTGKAVQWSEKWSNHFNGIIDLQKQQSNSKNN
jgi:acyl-CoA thioester hydrolase